MKECENMNIVDKYNLTLEENIFLAKRNLVDNIYANAKGATVPI